jgi:phosphatidylserine decarboxylase
VSTWREKIGRGLATAVSAPGLSRLTGRLADLSPPRWLLERIIRLYARLVGVTLAEASGPPDAYPTFNAFFTRRLRPGLRPIASEAGTVVSPSDSAVVVIGPLPADGRLEQVKGRHYSVEALLGSAEEAAPFRQGVAATLYLSPAMYHRVHVPVDGHVTGWRYVPGRLFPVNAPSVRAVPGLYTRNERVVVFLDAPGHGSVAVVLVGAANVGRISLAFSELMTNSGAAAARVTPPQPLPVRRGDELGTFNLGSTVVLLVADPALRPAAGVVPGALVRVGEPLWTPPSGRVAGSGPTG